MTRIRIENQYQYCVGSIASHAARIPELIEDVHRV
jgi:hypothetical protein